LPPPYPHDILSRWLTGLDRAVCSRVTRKLAPTGSRMVRSLESHTMLRRYPLDWTILGALGEFFGAIAVVGSLLYLARQVRQANRIARADAYRATLSRTLDLTGKWASDSDWAELYIRIRFQGTRRKDLDTTERAVAGLHVQTLAQNYAAIHHDVRLGILPSSAYGIVGEGTIRTPYFQDVWPLLREEHSPDFVKFLEERFGLAESSGSVTELPPGPGSSPANPEKVTGP